MHKLICGIILNFLILLFPSAISAATYINEFSAHPSGDEWVEFYNPDGTDLTSYWIDDDTSFTDDSGSTGKKLLSTLNTTSSTYPYIVLTSSMFNNSGDYVVLFSGDGTLIDSYQYTNDPGVDVIIGRSPNGGAWSVGLTASQGATNPAAPTATPTPTPTPAPTSTPTSAPSATSTPTPTTKPTNTPTPTTKPSNTPTPSSKPSPTQIPISQGKEQIVLGVQNDNKIAQEEKIATDEAKTAGWKTPVIAAAFILPGLGLIGYSIYSYVKKSS
ncbi:MAG: hypothetical protein AAB599_01885 [Patescibacteria group bacterium]